MKSLPGKTPFELIKGFLLHLYDFPEWGCCVWVHNTDSGKLGVCTICRHWVGFASNSNGHCTSFPDKCSVNIEHSVAFSMIDIMMEDIQDNVDLSLEGEGKENTMPEPVPEQQITIEPVNTPNPPEPEICSSTHICKPTQKILDIQKSTGVLPAGVQVPSQQPELEKKTLSTDTDAKEDDIPGIAMAIAMADSHGMEPKTLAEAMRRPE